MKQGSIVAIKPIIVPDHLKSQMSWFPTTDEKTPYVIREIIQYPDGPGAIFEEGVIGYSLGFEIGIDLEYLIELLPSENISEMISEIQENYQVIQI